VDGNDFLAVHAVTVWAAERARAGLGATLIELVTYRASAHSTSDDPRATVQERGGCLALAIRWNAEAAFDRARRVSEERHESLTRELGDQLASAWKEACSYGTLSEPLGQTR